MYDIPNLNHNIMIRNQFKYDANNVLLDELTYATGLTGDAVKRLATSVCKEITFGLEAIAKGLIKTDIKTYFKDCVDKGYVRKEDGWLNESWGISNGVFEHSFGDKFNITAQAFASYNEFIGYANTQDNLVCTLRIKSMTGGYHSLICYKLNGSQLYISDTSSRGVAVLFDHFINASNLIYITCMDG